MPDEFIFGSTADRRQRILPPGAARFRGTRRGNAGVRGTRRIESCRRGTIASVTRANRRAATAFDRSDQPLGPPS